MKNIKMVSKFVRGDMEFEVSKILDSNEPGDKCCNVQKMSRTGIISDYCSSHRV